MIELSHLARALSLTFTKFTPPRFESVKDRNQKFEEDLASNIINDTKVAYPQDTSYMSFPNAPRETEEQARESRKAERRLSLAMDAYDQEFSDGMIEDTRKELWKNLANVDGSIAAEVISNLDKIGISNLKTGNKEAKRDYVHHIKSTVKKSNVIILSRVDEVQTVKP